MKFRTFVVLSVLTGLGVAGAGEIDPSQKEWVPKYQKQKNAPKAEEMLLNESPEPELGEGFVDLLGSGDLEAWESKGGNSTFELKGGIITGTCVSGEASTYLCTKKTDYADFVFSCEMKWEVDLNSGVMFRGQSGEKHAVFGPQVEMEGVKNTRGWSGGIYGQSCGGYWYPLWLKEHAKVRQALNKEGWNRVTIEAKGEVVKTWVNGVPAAHWAGSEDYLSGYIGLQVHKAKSGKVLWRNLKIKELKSKVSRLDELDAYWAEVSRTVTEGDFEGYKATCHPEGVLVSGKKEKSYPLMKALAGWKKEFDATKEGEMKAEVAFRFSKRLGDETTAHETGMFRYASATDGGEMKAVYIHLEALLVKHDSWKVVMEYQKSEGTKEEWEKLE